MTVIVCKKEQNELTFAADSSITYGGRIQIIDRDCKIATPMDDITILGTGNPEDFALFRLFVVEHFEFHAIEQTIGALTYMMTKFKEWASERGKELICDGSFYTDYIMRLQDKAYAVEGYHIREITQFCALGDGMDTALGAFEMGASAEEAVRVACKYNIYCAEPIVVVRHALVA